MVAPCIATLDPANIAWEDLLAACDICSTVWPHEGVTAESGARSYRERQARKEFTPGDNQWYVIRDGAGPRIVAHAACFSRKIAIAGKPYTVLGMGAVCTRPEFRKQGLGSAVVKACFARVDRGEFPWCLFQTSHKNRPFYEHLSCRLITNRLVNSLGKDPLADPFWDEIRMAYPANRSVPAGTIDMLGPGY